MQISPLIKLQRNNSEEFPRVNDIIIKSKVRDNGTRHKTRDCIDTVER